LNVWADPRSAKVRQATQITIFNSRCLERALALWMERITCHAIDAVVDRRDISVVWWGWESSENIAGVWKMSAFETWWC
jgi:hypothetical protein